MFCAISSFVTMFSKRRLLQRRQKASIWGKGLIQFLWFYTSFETTSLERKMTLRDQLSSSLLSVHLSPIHLLTYWPSSFYYNLNFYFVNCIWITLNPSLIYRCLLMPLQQTAFENIMAKGEIAHHDLMIKFSFVEIFHVLKLVYLFWKSSSVVYGKGLKGQHNYPWSLGDQI